MSLQPSGNNISGSARNRQRVALAALCAFLFLILLGLAVFLQRSVAGASTVARLDSGELLNLTNLWRIHLAFTPEQWKALEPQGGGMGGPGGPGGPGGFGGPGFPPGAGGGPQGGPGRPRGPGGFGPGIVISPAFLNQGDSDKDRKLSKQEFSALAEALFKAWDTNKSGTLDSGKIRRGLDSLVASAPALGGRAPQGPPGPLAGAGPNRNRYPVARADLDFENWLFPDIAVRYKGNNTYMTSRNSFKRPLKIDLNNGWKGRRLGGITELNLHNNVNDPGAMNEPLSYRLYRDAGVPAPRTAYAKLYVSVPNQYTNQFVGVYSLVENLDNDFLRSRFGTTRGALFKPTTRQVFEDAGPAWSDYERSYNPKTPVFEHQTRRVIEFSQLVSHASDAEFAARLEEFLDLEEFARFMAVTVWLSNMDSILSMGQNFYVYLHPKTQQFQFLPWDFDHSFGQFPMAGSSAELENLSILKPWAGQVRFLERVFKVDKFKAIYLARLKEFNGTIFQPARIQKQVDELAPVLRPAIAEESSQLLARFDQVVAGKEGGMGGFGGPPPVRGTPGSSPRGNQEQIARNRGPEDFDAGGPGGPPFGGRPGGMGQSMKPIRTFVSVRAISVSDQLAGKSAGKVLSASGPGGPPGGPGGRGGPGRGGPGGFDPGQFLAEAFTAALGSGDEPVTQDEFSRRFAAWFDAWNTEKSGALTEEQIQAGLNKNLGFSPGGPPPGPGDFGPPGDFPGF